MASKHRLPLKLLDQIHGGGLTTSTHGTYEPERVTEQEDRFNRAYYGMEGQDGGQPYFHNDKTFFDRKDLSPTEVEGLRALRDGPGEGKENPLSDDTRAKIGGMVDAYEKGEKGEADPLWPKGEGEGEQDMRDRAPTDRGPGPTDANLGGGDSQYAGYEGGTDAQYAAYDGGGASNEGSGGYDNGESYDQYADAGYGGGSEGGGGYDNYEGGGEGGYG